MPHVHTAEQTRLRLLSAAAEEINEHGYSAATLSAIAARVGLTKGALGHHFPTKQAFVTAIFEHANHLAGEAAAQAREMFPASALRACIAYFAMIARTGAVDPMTRAALIMYQDRSVPVSLAAATFDQLRQHVEAFLTDYVNAEAGDLAMPPAAATQLLQMMTIGELAISRFLPQYSPQDAVSAFTAVFTGIGVPDAGSIVTDGVGAVLAGETTG